MVSRNSDWLHCEIRHKGEQFRERYERLQIRDCINENPRKVVIVALLSGFLLIVTLLLTGEEPSGRHYPRNRNAWFYDRNTDTLFLASNRLTGPIEAPSGPLSNGQPAGLKAHVYSYVPDPNEADLFVGFLEMPDPRANVKQLVLDQSDFRQWARGRVIKRVDDDKWVSPTSRSGQEIIQELTRPNDLGQTPIYQLPR